MDGERVLAAPVLVASGSLVLDDGRCCHRCGEVCAGVHRPNPGEAVLHRCLVVDPLLGLHHADDVVRIAARHSSSLEEPTPSDDPPGQHPSRCKSDAAHGGRDCNDQDQLRA